MRKFTRSWVQKNHTVEENSPWIPQISAYLIHIEPVLFCLLSCLYSKLPYKIQPFYLQNGGQLFIVQNNKDNGPSGEKPGQDCLQLVIKDVGFLKPSFSAVTWTTARTVHTKVTAPFHTGRGVRRREELTWTWTSGWSVRCERNKVLSDSQVSCLLPASIKL